MWSDELDDYTISQLAHSYTRRKQYEAKLLASHLMGPATQRKEQGAPTGQQVSMDTMFDMMGVSFAGE